MYADDHLKINDEESFFLSISFINHFIRDIFYFELWCIDSKLWHHTV